MKFLPLQLTGLALSLLIFTSCKEEKKTTPDKTPQSNTETVTKKVADKNESTSTKEVTPKNPVAKESSPKSVPKMKDEKVETKQKVEAVKKAPVTKVTKTLSAAEFKKLIDAGHVQLVDIRTQREFAQNHLKGAVMFDFYKRSFANDMSSSKLDKSKPVYIYCRTGRRTGIALKQLSAVGFNEVYDLGGGIVSWAQKAYPIER